MRNKHLRRELIKLGYSKKEITRQVRVYRKFKYKFNNAAIFFSLKNRAHLTKFAMHRVENVNSMAIAAKQLSAALNNMVMCIGNLLFDPGELAFLYSTGND